MGDGAMCHYCRRYECVCRLPEAFQAREAPPVRIEVPPFGFVEYAEHMGSDEIIAECARVSYSKGTKRVSTHEALIRRLLRKDHTSPFEMAEIRWRIAAPIFVARQLVRTRTANWNETSLRYSEAEPNRVWHPLDPNEVRAQGKKNAQVGEGELTTDRAAAAFEVFQDAHADAEAYYEQLLTLGVCREQARGVLPVDLYTTWYFKIDLNNLMKMLSKRMAYEAQAETRAVAFAMFEHFKALFPMTAAAFQDVHLDGARLTGRQLTALRSWLNQSLLPQNKNGLESFALQYCTKSANDSEADELVRLVFPEPRQ